MTGVRASRSRCTASRVPVNPAPTMAIRGVAVTGARIVHDTCMDRSEAYPFSRHESRSGDARRRAGDAPISALLNRQELGTSRPTILRRVRISAIRMEILPLRVVASRLQCPLPEHL